MKTKISEYRASVNVQIFTTETTKNYPYFLNLDLKRHNTVKNAEKKAMENSISIKNVNSKLRGW